MQAAALEQRADRLQREAAAVMQDLDLARRLSEFGRVIPTGSSTYGLMVSRDIDLYVVRDAWTPALCWQALSAAFAQDRLQSIRLSKWLGRDRTEALPEGFSAVLRYYTHTRDQWRVDLWFFTPPQAESNLGWHRELLRTLSPELRLAMLWIKDVRHPLPDYSSAEVYAAVLHHGVRTPAAFERHVADGAAGRRAADGPTLLRRPAFVQLC